jgi:thioredoxin 2
MAWPKTDTPVHIVCPHCAGVNRIHPGQNPKSAKCGRCQTKLFSGKPRPVTRKTFDKLITKNEIPVVVDFWAEWCGPCKAMAPIYERAAEDLEPAYLFVTLDTEAEPELAARYQIRAIPTLMIVLNGRVIAQRAGAIDRRTLESWLEAQPVV